MTRLTLRRLGILLWTLCVCPAVACAQTNLDFEDGLRGWTATGDAFAGQPIDLQTIDTDRFPASPLGGDYWNASTYSLGQHGRYALSSSNAGRGALASEWFALSSDVRYFSILVGGAPADGRSRVELQVEGAGGAATVAWTTATPGIDLLQQRVFAIPSELAGRRVRVVVVDDSAESHITVDDARVTAGVPVLGDGPVWGIGDYHTHPMAHLGFGALRGVRALWGRPGTVAADYARDPSLFELDLPQCSNDHGGGRTAGIFINTVEKRLLTRDVKPHGFIDIVQALFKLLFGGFTRHGDSGAPGFTDFPTFLSGAHEQMHITQIHRAWQGGLRLMVALAVHNEGVEFLTGSPKSESPSTEREVLEAEVCGMRRLAAHNADWMQIAYSPAEARQIIRSGRLAVILGAEFDRLGELGGMASLDDEIQYLWDLGIRQVTPIHGIDNRLGGASIFEPAYNSLNDFLKRGPTRLEASDLPSWQPVFFDVRNGGCAAGPLAGIRGECVPFKLSQSQDRAALSRTVFSPFSAAPTLIDVQVPRYAEHNGHMNVRGLTADGRTYINALLSRGMIVGLEHMSQQSVDDVYGLVAARLAAAGEDGCTAFGTGDTPPACDEHASPFFVSHARFRALAFQDRKLTTAEGFLANEFDIGDRQLTIARRTGGVVGVFTFMNPLQSHPSVTAPFPNDCASSSTTFAYSYLYGLAAMGGRGAGIATDFTFVPATGPRFGENACWGLKQQWDARPGGPLAGQYHPERQENGIRYAGRTPAPGVRVGLNAPLLPYTMGKRTFDFNVDGLAHYGLLPDLLQDLKNIGLGRREFDALFSSAEAFIVMWEKAERVAGFDAPGPFVPRPLPCEQLCRGLCP